MIGAAFDSVLIAAREGAEWAWERIYRDLAGQVRAYLRLRGAADPDDLLGETFLVVARGIARFEGDERAFRSWVFLTAHHRLLDALRRAARRPVAADLVDPPELPAPDDPEAEAIAALGTDRVRRLLDTLTAEQRDVLTLRIVGELTVNEIAELLGKEPGAVKALQRRALRRLRKILESPVPLSGPATLTGGR